MTNHTHDQPHAPLASLQGTIEGSPHGYVLDSGHTFETGRRTAVCGNTAAMVGEKGVSWLSKHFEVRFTAGCSAS